MNNRTISFSIKICILIAALTGIFVCTQIYPFTASLEAFGLSPDGTRPWTDAQYLKFWSMLIFYWVMSLPCFAVLLIGWLVSGDIKKDNLFSLGAVKRLKAAFLILFFSSCIFLAGNIVFRALDWSVFATMYAFIAVVGIIMSFGIYVLSKFVSKAQLLKEENDSIL